VLLMVKKSKNSHHGIAITAIVSIVAIVGLIMMFSGSITGAAVSDSTGSEPGACVIGPNQGSNARSLGTGVAGSASSVCDAAAQGCGSCVQTCRQFTKINDKYGCPLDGADGYCNPDYQQTDVDCCGRNNFCNPACAQGEDPDCCDADGYCNLACGSRGDTDCAEVCNDGYDNNRDGERDCFDPECDGSAQCPWFVQYQAPVGTGDVFAGPSFPDASNGWITGRFLDNILYTQDGGQSWTEQYKDSSLFGFGDVKFVNTTHGWAGTGGNTTWTADIYGTVDGGQTWTIQDTFQDFNGISDIVAPDANHVYGVGRNINGEMVSSHDGGATWIVRTLPSTIGDPGLDFADANNGWVVGSAGIIFRTSDAGVTWTTQNSGLTTHLYDVDFINANEGWAVSQGAIIHTVDGGATWTNLPTPAGFNFGYDIHFIDSNIGYVGGEPRGYMYKTMDGGLTWNRQTLPSNGFGVREMDFVSPTEGWVVGRDFRTNRGFVIHTTTGGE
jgi:photosystem II stability/assembly factor-like uncharacterized protein